MAAIASLHVEPKEPELPKGRRGIEMSEAARRKAYSLVRSWCAYFDRSSGECLLLDCDCPQLKSFSICCKYFREAVLPMDKALEAEIMSADHVKTCGKCGRAFRALSNRAIYCKRCGEIEARIKAAERKRKQRCNVTV